MSNGLPDYPIIDYGGIARLDVSHNRRFSPVGTCIHTTNGVDSLSWLLGGSAIDGSPASSDYLIDRTGQRFRLCKPERYPYHAGVSTLDYNNKLYHGDEVSELLIGIELEARSNELVTWQQVDSLAQTVVECGFTYGWRWPYYVLGHYEIAKPIGRRSDPLGFDWGSFMGRLYVRSLDAGVPGLRL